MLPISDFVWVKSSKEAVDDVPVASILIYLKFNYT